MLDEGTLEKTLGEKLDVEMSQWVDLDKRVQE